MAESTVDVAIVGAGAAGLTAAIYAARNGLKARIFEAKHAGGMAADAVEIENYPGAGKVRGKELMEKFISQAEGFGVKIGEGKKVSGIEKNKTKPALFGRAPEWAHFGESQNSAGGFLVTVGEGKGTEKINAKAIILATGSQYKKLGVKGEDELKGKGVSFCAVCDGAFFRGRDVVVVGGGNTGVTYALYLAEICKSVTLVEFMPALGADRIYWGKLEEKKVNVLLNREVTEILGTEKGFVEGIRVKERGGGKKEKTIPSSGVFVSIGIRPNSELAKSAGIETDKKGFVRVNRETMESSVQGIFAAGDVIGGVEQVVVAAGEGATAAVSAFRFLGRGGGKP
ncbi:MAG: FAD-dependent oxidoreductase [Candidatus Diapherotrites archaeon]